MPKQNNKCDCQWFLAKDLAKKKQRKTPRAYSTKASQDLIVELSKQYETIQDVYNNIHYDDDAKRILKMYIDNGEGGLKAREMFDLEYVRTKRILEAVQCLSVLTSLTDDEKQKKQLQEIITEIMVRR